MPRASPKGRPRAASTVTNGPSPNPAIQPPNARGAKIAASVPRPAAPRECAKRGAVTRLLATTAAFATDSRPNAAPSEPVAGRASAVRTSVTCMPSSRQVDLARGETSVRLRELPAGGRHRPPATARARGASRCEARPLEVTTLTPISRRDHGPRRTRTRRCDIRPARGGPSPRSHRPRCHRSRDDAIPERRDLREEPAVGGRAECPIRCLRNPI